MAASLREIKQRMRPLFTQERVATNAGLFLEGLLGDEQRKTGWMRAEAAGDPGPWRQQAILGRRDWDADTLRDTFAKFVAANGYKPLVISNEQTIVNSESEALTIIGNASSNGATPSIRMLLGKWFATNPCVCKGAAGQTEGLLTYSTSKFIGYESACDINKVAADKSRLRVSFTCYGEGTASKETEFYEFVSPTEAKRTTFDGKRSYTFIMRRCP